MGLALVESVEAPKGALVFKQSNQSGTNDIVFVKLFFIILADQVHHMYVVPFSLRRPILRKSLITSYLVVLRCR
jgi:hypothetical protein